MLFTVNERAISYYNHETPEVIVHKFFCLCLFLSYCFHAVKGKLLEPTFILFKWPYNLLMSKDKWVATFSLQDRSLDMSLKTKPIENIEIRG